MNVASYVSKNVGYYRLDYINLKYFLFDENLALINICCSKPKPARIINCKFKIVSRKKEILFMLKHLSIWIKDQINRNVVIRV